jgi:RimJ/RimL family protein N-acetyltransferase
MYEGRLVRLREFRAEDAAECVTWLNDIDTATKLSGGAPMPQTLEAEREWLSRAGDRNFAVETRAGAFIGTCGFFDLSDQSRSCSVGWMIGDKTARGKGYGTEMIELLLQYLFVRRNLERVALKVFAYNEGAVRLYERMGFVREAIYREQAYSMGRYWDEYGYSMLKGEYLARYGD